MDVKTIREGGNNGAQIRLTGPMNFGQLTLKRGMTANFDLWDWFKAMLTNPALRADAEVVLLAGDGKTGLELFRAHRPVAVVLDLILPHISGRELCQTMKALSSDTPVIVLSAITEVVDKVLLLELGADDYVTKPFSPRELMARVQAAIRRRRRPALRA